MDDEVSREYGIDDIPAWADASPALRRLPKETMTILECICRGDNIDLGGTHPPNGLDVCEEIPSSMVAEVLQLVRSSSSPHAGLDVGLQPAWTLFEVCARLGQDNQLCQLRSAAQARLCQAVFKQEATLPEVLRLFRAGAEPLRRHLTSIAAIPANGDLGEPVAKRPRVEGLPGTPLHWVCRMAGRLEKLRVESYVEIARWLCQASPLALLLGDDHGRTPLEVLLDGNSSMGNSDASDRHPTIDPASPKLCAVCRVRGHDGKDCNSLGVGLPEVLVAISESLAVVVDRYPLRAAALLVSARPSTISNADTREAVPPLRAAALRARNIVLARSDGHGRSTVNARAVDGIDALLACVGVDGSVPLMAVAPNTVATALHAADALTSLAAAQARKRALDGLSVAASFHAGAADLGVARALLAESEAKRRHETSALETRVEKLEAELAAAQRRTEVLEAYSSLPPNMSPDSSVANGKEAAQKNKLAEVSVEAATCGARVISGLAIDASGGASSEASFVAQLRRQRLVDDHGGPGSMAELPAHVREGVAHLSKSLCAAVERLASDLYESECHFIYEVIQNAEDAHARGTITGTEQRGPPALSLRLGSCASTGFTSYFVSDNNEAGFTERDVAALCDISASSKTRVGPGEAIGCKGIGFKSVFTVSDRPHVLSRGFTFVFDVLGPLGKLGYVTPTWLDATAIEALPAEVRASHAAGRTVLFLPLRSPGFAEAIEREMGEFATRGRATMLFLKRLRRIELCRGPGIVPLLLHCRRGDVEGAIEEMFVVAEECSADGTNSVRAEHRYLLHRHCVGAAAELVIACPAAAGDTIAAAAGGMSAIAQAVGNEVVGSEASMAMGATEQIYCTLPVRGVGFGFALQCNRFDLVANRGDFHRGSAANKAIRDALPEAFAAACAARKEVAARALVLVGESVSDPFWRVAREGVLAALASVACVTTAAGPRQPSEILLRGRGDEAGPLAAVAALLPPELVLKACGRAFAAAEAVPDAATERLLRRLGAEDFGPVHLCKCLAFSCSPWPFGWVHEIWHAGGDAAPRAMRTLYAALGSVATGGVAEGNYVSVVLNMPSLPLFPLAAGATSKIPPSACLEDGGVHRCTCSSLPSRWQRALANAGALRLLPSALVGALDGPAVAFLDAAGVGEASSTELAKAALAVQLRLAAAPASLGPLHSALDEGLDFAVPKWCWSSLGVIRDLWLKRSRGASGGGSDAAPSEARRADAAMGLEDGLVQLGFCSSHEEAQRSVDGPGLRALLLAPCRDGKLRHPAGLRCHTVLGLAGILADDLAARVHAFLGIPCGSCDASGLVARGEAAHREVALEPWPDLEEGGGGGGASGAEAWREALLWEAFFVGGLGAQRLRPGTRAAGLGVQGGLHPRQRLLRMWLDVFALQRLTQRSQRT